MKKILGSVKSLATKPSTWVIFALGGIAALSFSSVASVLAPAANAIAKAKAGATTSNTSNGTAVAS